VIRGLHLRGLREPNHKEVTKKRRRFLQRRRRSRQLELFNEFISNKINALRVLAQCVHIVYTSNNLFFWVSA